MSTNAGTNRKQNVIFIEHNLPEPYQHVNMLSRNSNYYLEEHSHPMFQMIWVIQGVLLLEHKGVQHHMSRGHFCMIPPGHPHALRSENGYMQIGIDLTDSLDSRGIVSLMTKQVTDFVVLDRSDMLSVIGDLEAKRKELTMLARLQMVHILDSLILTCIELLNSEMSFRSKLLVLMKLHLSSNLTLDDIASQLAISQSTLQRITNREFGCSVLELYHQLKLNKACSLLLNTDMSNTDIAESLGFTDPAHFSRFFKQKMNLTPLQYKKNSSLSL